MNVDVLHVLTNYNTTPEQIHGRFFNMSWVSTQRRRSQPAFIMIMIMKLVSVCVS